MRILLSSAQPLPRSLDSLRARLELFFHFIIITIIAINSRLQQFRNVRRLRHTALHLLLRRDAWILRWRRLLAVPERLRRSEVLDTVQLDQRRCSEFDRSTAVRLQKFSHGLVRFDVQ